MIKNHLYQALRTAVVFFFGAWVIACGENNPDNTDPPEPGPGPGPGPEPEELVLHDYSSGKTDVKVLSLDYSDNGNMLFTFNGPKDQLPKVDEYLVSAPTELAPYGYLVRVVKVTEEPSTKGIGDTVEELKAKVEAVNAAINEVIQSININKVFFIPLPDVCFEDFKPILDGLSFSMRTWGEDDPLITEHPFTADGELELIAGYVSENDGEPKKKGHKVSMDFDAFEIDGYKIKTDFSLDQKGIYFFLQVLEGSFQKIGFDYEASFSFSLELQKTYKGKLVDRKIPLGSLVQSYIIPVGEVPVVLTLVIPIILEIKLDGSLGFTFRPLDVDLDIGIGTYYDFPRKSFYPYGTHQKIVDVVDKTSQKDYLLFGNMQSDLTMKGSFSLDLSTGISVGLYGCNIIDRKAGFMIDGKRLDGSSRSSTEKALMKAFKDMIEAEAMVDTKGEFSAKLEVGSIGEVAADMYIKDDCGFKWDVGAKLAGSFKVPFVGDFTPTWDTPRYTFYDTKDDIRCPHTLFFSGFSKLDVVEAPTNPDNLVVSVVKSKPLFGYHPYAERSFGLYFVPSDLKNDAMGTSSPYWKQYNLSGKPGYTYETNPRWFEIVESIPKSEFEKGRYYDVYAYTEIDGPIFGDIYLFRTNKQFRITETGSLSTIDLDDVPGQDL